MALVTYNSIPLPYSDLTDFRMEAVYDESNTDRYLTKFLISVQTIIAPDYMAVINPTLRLANPVDITHYIYQSLMTPRKQLSLQFNGVEMIPERQTGVRGYVDAANGPIPKRCEIITVDGATNGTFLLLYEIEANYWINQGPVPAIDALNRNLPGNVVLYNRWSETVELDGQNRTTKTRRGKLMIRSDNVKGWIADQVRALMAVTGLPPGRFLRERSSYTVDPNGLGLQYEIVDKEVFRLPPPPAFKSEGVYSEEGTKGDGKRYVTYRIKLWGDNDTNQMQLLKTAGAIAIAKVVGAGANIATNPGLIMNSSLAVSSYENWVEFSVRGLIDTSKGRIKTQAAQNQNPAGGGIVGAILNPGGFLFGNQGGGGNNQPAGAMAAAAFKAAAIPVSRNPTLMPDPATIPIYTVRGTANILLQAARYYDPSFANVALVGGNQLSQQNDNNDISNSPDIQLSRGRAPGTAGVNPE